MTVTIHNRDLYEKYQETVQRPMAPMGRVAFFSNAVWEASLLPNAREYLSVIDALLTGESVEYQEVLKRLPVPGMYSDNGQQFITRRKDGGEYFICGENNPNVRNGKLVQAFDQEEIDYIRDVWGSSHLTSVETY